MSEGCRMRRGCIGYRVQRVQGVQRCAGYAGCTDGPESAEEVDSAKCAEGQVTQRVMM